MMRRRLEKKEEPAAGAPLWMVTYSDTVTLLLAFFVLMNSFSTIDARRFREVILSMRGALGVLETGQTLVPDAQLRTGDPKDGTLLQMNEMYLPDLQQMALVEARLHQSLDELGYGSVVTLTVQERGLIIRFADRILFDTGRADLRAEAIPILDRLVGILADLPNQIRVEGHTDDVPIRTVQFRSNWELSASRATSVIHYFLDRPDAFNPGRVSAAGYGEYRPIGDNATEAGRQQNRRVDIVVMYITESGREPR